MSVVVYGDFNCPYSYLACLRVDILVAAGIDVEWRAVEHAPGLPVTGRRLDAAGGAQVEAELNAVRELLTAGERLPTGALTSLPKTDAAIAGYSEAFGVGAAHDVRRLLFNAYWARGLDIGSPEVLRALLAPALKGSDSEAFSLRQSGYAVSANRGPITAAAYHRVNAWRDDWRRAQTQTTPTLVAKGVTFAGVEALDQLARTVRAPSIATA